MKTEKIRVIDYAKSRKIQARDVMEAAKTADMVINAMTLITYHEAAALDVACASIEGIETTETLGELFKRMLEENIQFHKERQRKRFERIDEMRAQGLPTPRRQSRTDRDPVGAPQRDGERRPFNNDRPRRDGERRPYNNDRPQRDGERRPYNNDRPQRDGERRPYNNDRPQRDGERRPYNNDRPQRDGERRPYNNDRPQRDGERRPY
ncbi:MAG: hypothetical protein ACRC5Q_00590, partial [Culicoidibacterales bacterium]